jgi:uncharacterized protein
VTPTVLLVAKAPVPGRSKTRLSPPLTPEQAASLQRALLLDTLDACRAEVPETGLLHAEEAEAPVLAELAGPGTRLVLQEGRGLGAALSRGIERFVEGGPVALVSSDVPGIPPGSLGRAFAALAGGADVVLGPALDGGYWLIAMKEANPALFREIPWSTPAVYGVTARRCQEAGLELAVLETWRDVDTAVDLGALLEELDEVDAPRTSAALVELAGTGAIDPGSPGLGLVSSELVEGSTWRAVVHDRLRDRSGRDTAYTYLAVPRAVFTVPVTDDGEVVLVRQYRHPVRDWTLEVPAGSVGDGELPLEAARRELAEETGGRARSWRHLSTFYSSSAHVSLRSDAFLATGVTLAEPSPDEGEELQLVRTPVAQALAQARAGGFAEGQTALCILLAARYLDE